MRNYIHLHVITEGGLTIVILLFPVVCVAFFVPPFLSYSLPLYFVDFYSDML